jgi:hypothetical protein
MTVGPASRQSLPLHGSFRGDGGPGSKAGIALGALALLLSTGCSPTVKVEAPDKPIVINLNVKIEQEVRIKVDRDVDELVKSNPNIF